MTEYIDGTLLAQSDISEQEKIKLCLALMDKLHAITFSTEQINNFIPVLNPKKIIEGLLAQLADAIALTSPQFQTFSTGQFHSIKEVIGAFIEVLKLDSQDLSVDEWQARLVLCHGDLNFSNVMTLENKRYLLDFECACLAEKAFDLGMMLAINKCSLEQVIWVGKSTNSPQEKVTRYYLLSLLINGLWFLLASINESSQRVKKQLLNQAKPQFRLFDETNGLSKKLSDIL